jgi:hypothetical protein
MNVLFVSLLIISNLSVFFFYSFVPYFMRIGIDCCAYRILDLSMITACNSLTAVLRIFVGTACLKMFASRFRISKSELILKVGFVYVAMTLLSCESTLRSGMFVSMLKVRYSNELRSVSS